MVNLLHGKKKRIYLFLIVFLVLVFSLVSNREGKKVSIASQDELSPTNYQEVKSSKDVPTPTEIADRVTAEIMHPERVSVRVVKIIDGDTIEVDLGGGNVRTVRYIGIDTPESVDPRRSVECFGKEASNMNTSIVGGRIVQLEKDVSENDKYGRLLRYVYVEGLFVNLYLVEEGFANASAYPPDIKYQEDLESAEEEARLNNKGLWGSCAGVAASIQRKDSNSSADKDCSDFSTQLEAQEYFDTRGGSPTNNVDRLDGSDHDGKVCETLQ
jgi:micrococcal nuclease